MMRDVSTVEYGEPVSFDLSPSVTVAGTFGGVNQLGQVLVITPTDVWSRPPGDVLDKDGRALGVDDDPPLMSLLPDLE